MTAKPYTLEGFLAECGPARCDPDFDRLRATVEALAAALAELAAAEALNAAQLDEMAKVTEENARLRREMPTADQMIINRNDYERLIASLPAGPRVVR